MTSRFPDLGDEAHLRELARQPLERRVGELRAQLNGSGLRVHAARGEVEAAVVGGDRAVGAEDLHARGLARSADAVVVAFSEREAHPHRVYLRERGEERGLGVGGDEAPFGAKRAAADAADGRGDARIGEVELRLLELRVGRGDRGFGLARGRPRLVELALADRLLGGEGLEALRLELGEAAARALLHERRAGLLRSEVVGRRIDDEEDFACRHSRALVVEALLEDSRDARADLDLARALGLADRLERDRHALRLGADRGHGERGRGGGGRWGGAAALVLAAGCEQQRARDDGGGARRDGGLHGIAYYTYLPERI